MKKTLFQVLIILLLQFALYYGLTKLHFDFSYAYFTSFIFSLLLAGLVIEGSVIKNVAFYTMSMINFIAVMVIFFALPASFSLDKAKISQVNLTAIQSLKQQTQISYPKQDHEKIKTAMTALTLYSYQKAQKEIQTLSRKNFFAEFLESYRVKKTKDLNLKISLAKKFVPRFETYYKYFAFAKYPEFMKNIEFARDKHPVVEEFYTLAKDLMTMKTSQELFLHKLSQEIENFLKTYNYSGDLIYHLLYFYPEYQNKYSSYLTKYEREKITFLDLAGFSAGSLEVRNLFTIATLKDKGEFFIKADSLIEPANGYPLFASNFQMLSTKGELTVIPFAKISRDALVYQSGNSFKNIILPGIHLKIRNTIELLKKPLNLFWIIKYRSEYPEVFHHIVKPFWLKLIKFFIIFFGLLLLSFFVIKYFKTIFPKKIHFLFYFLPIIFIVIFSAVITNLVLKAINWLL